MVLDGEGWLAASSGPSIAEPCTKDLLGECPFCNFVLEAKKDNGPRLPDAGVALLLLLGITRNRGYL